LCRYVLQFQYSADQGIVFSNVVFRREHDCIINTVETGDSLEALRAGQSGRLRRNSWPTQGWTRRRVSSKERQMYEYNYETCKRVATGLVSIFFRGRLSALLMRSTCNGADLGNACPQPVILPNIRISRSDWPVVTITRFFFGSRSRQCLFETARVLLYPMARLSRRNQP